MKTSELLDALWRDYVATTPQAERIHHLLTERGEIIKNDHVALRTYGAAGIGIDALARPFEALGWHARDEYRFADKHLRARYWQHAEAGLPKVFISELILDELSDAARTIVQRLLAQLPAGFVVHPTAGRPWTVSYDDYSVLRAESEYAAWVAAFGFRVNHFTVDVGALSTFPDIASIDAFLAEHGFTLNDSGGLVKGSPSDRLEQSSTRADSIDVTFSDRTARVPSCYYEFAKRYPLPSGELFQGFVPASADKIFESTDVRPTR